MQKLLREYAHDLEFLEALERQERESKTLQQMTEFKQQVKNRNLAKAKSFCHSLALGAGKPPSKVSSLGRTNSNHAYKLVKVGSFGEINQAEAGFSMRLEKGEDC